MENNWKIEVQNRPAQFLTDIWIFRKTNMGDGIILYTFNNVKNTVTEKTYKHGEEKIPPTLTIPSGLLPALQEALTRKGINVPEESFTKGKLEATQVHLEDMRKLIFEKKGR